MKQTELRRRQQEAPEMEIITVDPDKAAELLRLNKGNRLPKNKFIARFTEMMKTGKWYDAAPEPLVFDVEGRLIDGQNRLHAVIHSGETIRFRVVRNQPPKIAHFLNTGAPRTLRDSLTIHEKEAVRNSEAVCFMRFLAGAYIVSPGELPYLPDELALLFHRYRKECAELFETKIFSMNRKGLCRAGIRAALMRAWVAKPDSHQELVRFAEILVSGVITSQKDLAVTGLRDWALTTKLPSTVQAAYDTYIRTEAAIVAFLNGNPVKHPRRILQEQFKIEEDALYE